MELRPIKMMMFVDQLTKVEPSPRWRGRKEQPGAKRATRNVDQVQVQMQVCFTLDVQVRPTTRLPAQIQSSLSR